MKFLVVDDDENSRVMLTVLLEGQGFTVASARNGREALAAAKDSPPDMIISDIFMPEMDGFKLCREVKSDPDLAHIPVIFYSSVFGDSKDIKLAQSLGVSRFIDKPLDQEGFAKTIREIIDEYRKGELPTPKAPKIPKEKMEAMYEEALSKKLQEKLNALEIEREELRASKKKYQQLIESLRKDFFFYTHDAKGVFTYVSPSITNILGYEVREFLTHFTKYLTDNPINDEVVAKTKLSLQGKDQPSYEVEIFDKSGSAHWLDVKEVPIFNDNGSVVAVEGIARDITLRKKAEEELQEHQNHLEELVQRRTEEIQNANLALKKSKNSLTTLISNLTGMVYHRKNDKDWAFSFASNGSIELTGYKPEDFTEGVITFNEIICPEDRARVWDEIQQSLEIQKPYMLNYKIITSNGKLRNVKEKGRGIWLENGKLEGLQGFIMDVTDEVATQEALIKTREQIAHSDKLTTLGKLVGSVAHEFNNPLYGVIGLIDNLGNDVTLEERERFTELAKKECWRMADMVKNLQSFYKPSEGILSSIDMNNMVKEVLSLIGKELKQKSIKITEHYHDGIDTVEAVEDQIKQVIINLLQNASDAVSGTGKEIVLTTDENESHVILKIQDTGSGIPEEYIKNIFDPFFTTKGVKGTGLGLSVSYGIIKKHGGEITVKSKVGKGSTFTLSLPLKGHVR
jgi:PAS domain S-box-containing protein